MKIFKNQSIYFFILLLVASSQIADAQPALVYDPPTQIIKVPSEIPTIQAALETVIAGGQVLVAPGIYNEALSVSGKHVQIVGDGSAEEVIIDASGILDSTVYIGAVSSPYHVSLLRNLTIRGGQGRIYNGNRHGGGVYTAGARLVIESSIIADNIAGSGGGIYVASRPMHIKDSLIKGNISYTGSTCGGGGLSIDSTQVIVERTQIVDNEILAGWGGGGVGTRGGTLLARHIVIANNRAHASGAMYINGRAELLNSTIVDNVTTQPNQGSILLFSISELPTTFTNTIVRNTETGSLGELFVTYALFDPIFTNSIVGGWTHEQEEVFNLDPGFVNPDHGNYDLAEDSPLINAGTENALLPGDLFDVMNRPRVVGANVDIGAYEFQEAGQCAEDINNDGQVNIGDLLIVLDSWGQCKGSCPADINGSGIVDIQDLLLLMNKWGQCS